MERKKDLLDRLLVGSYTFKIISRHMMAEFGNNPDIQRVDPVKKGFNLKGKPGGDLVYWD
ncbi:MAG: hypothetical protein F4073_04440 [Rhodobacteraceae bacterium]|nr:hypothetical protein [Paracoccaceae bacterium]MYF44959.1 hypothetical protein [Paracoccaceae bacterium]MYG10714.1 hypothetical protein [Paracoccaceae bacterium]MYI91186.1 hypothetical protein [Paracoccaceae bacterium]MYJ86299.1 hypothetical protein [Paracoccaceae bacterium]